MGDVVVFPFGHKREKPPLRNQAFRVSFGVMLAGHGENEAMRDLRKLLMKQLAELNVYDAVIEFEATVEH
jgi:hypothetical protein